MLRYVLVASFILVITLVSAALLRRAFPRAWVGWIRRVMVAGVGLASLSFALYKGSVEQGWGSVSWGAALVTAMITVALWLIFTSSLVWAPAAALVRWWERKTSPEVDPARRSFLQGAVAAVPASAAALSPVGTAAAMADPVLTPVEIKVEGLAPDLDGLKILQLSDIHLGTWIEATQVERIVETARPHAPDLVMLTGDLADDYEKLPAALAAVMSLAPALGVWACIGNHEIYRGRERFKEIMTQAQIGYLVGEGRAVKRGAATLWIAGADDPLRMGQDATPFLTRTIEQALAERPADAAATILMSHRPEGFDPAAARGVTLTLSGHTHGGQIALAGRSLFEGLVNMPYLLGHYQKGASHLYTTAGLGHWLPFRVGCPCEGALITLRAA